MAIDERSSDPWARAEAAACPLRGTGRPTFGSALILALWGLSAFCAATATPQAPADSNSVAAPEAAPRVLEVADLARIKKVEDPRFDPSGEWIAYLVKSADLVADKELSRAFMMPVAGGQPVPLTAEDGQVSTVRFSPDGRHISFLAGRDGPPQLYTLFRQGGEARQRTRVLQGVEDYAWAPDGRHLVLVMKDPSEDEKKAAEEAAEAKKTGKTADKAEQKARPWVTERRQFKADYVGYLDHRRDHLYLLDLEADEAEPRQLTAGPHDDSDPAWAPDGRHIAFVSNRTADPDSNDNTDIFLVEAFSPSAAPEETIQEPQPVTRTPGGDAEPTWSPDGRLIAHRTVVDLEKSVYATLHIGITPAMGGETTVLTTELDRWSSQPRFAPDGKSIYFRFEDRGQQPLGRQPIDEKGRPKGALERVVDGRDVVRGYSLGPAGSIAALIDRVDRPRELYLHRESGLEPLTRVNDELFAELRLGRVEHFAATSADGTEISSFVVFPPDYQEGKRYPALLNPHGGPMGQYDWRFADTAQILAAAGYIVLRPNPRGSTGYGTDFTYAIWQDWGHKDSEDVLAAVDEAIERGWADADRLGIYGWSYGAMLTYHLLVRTQRFDAAVAGAGTALYLPNYGHDHYQLWWEQELDLPWRNEDLWRRLSPFYQVEKITTPTLLTGGEKDWNVPIMNSEQLYQALRRLGVPSQLVVYPGEHHNLARPSFRLDLMKRQLDWFGRYVK